MFHFPTLSNHFHTPSVSICTRGNIWGFLDYFCVCGSNTTVLLTLVLWGSLQTGEGNYLRCGVPTPPQTTYLGQSTHTKANHLSWDESPENAMLQCPLLASQRIAAGAFENTSMKNMRGTLDMDSLMHAEHKKIISFSLTVGFTLDLSKLSIFRSKPHDKENKCFIARIMKCRLYCLDSI